MSYDQVDQPFQDLRKAVWYVQREIDRRERMRQSSKKIPDER